MKTRKNKKGGNVLFIMICAVLVAAIGVSGTLAFLTARSTEVDNTFKAKSEGISGEWVEPMFDSTAIKNLSPGVAVAKDPSIVNTTPTDDGQILVGARMTFFIQVDNNDYWAVDYATFSKFVTVTGLAGSGWTDITSEVTSEENIYGDGSYGIAKWYYYTTPLAKFDGTKPSNSSGSRVGDGSDNTTPLFTSVTMNPNIRIESGHEGYYVTLSDVLDENFTPDSSKYFEKFNFKIKLDGCGVKVDDVTVSGSVDTETAKRTLMSGLGGNIPTGD